MWQIISQLRPDHVFVLTIVAGGLTFLTLVSLGPALAYQWRHVREREAAMDVVHSMLQESKPIEEIERVLTAGGFGRNARPFASMGQSCRSKTRRYGFASGVHRAEHA